MNILIAIFLIIGIIAIGMGIKTGVEIKNKLKEIDRIFVKLNERNEQARKIMEKIKEI